MPQINITDVIYKEIKLLGRAWHVSDAIVVERLLDEFRAEPPVAGTDHATGEVRIYALYRGVKTEALFDPRTHAVTISSDPMAGTPFKSPTGAARAVVSQADPRVASERNGWTFWRIADTGELLQTLR